MLARLALTAATLGALALAAIPATAQDLLRVRLNADIRGTEPGTNRDANTDGLHWHVVEGLVALRADSTVGPMLAERIDVSEDGRTYTFPLRQGVRFHNGQPLTAADVVASIERYRRRDVNWRCRADLDSDVTRVTAVEAPDDRTVVIRLEKPSALFLTTLARTDCGQTGIYHRDSLNPDGTWRTPIGTGPFRMGEWRRGQFVELTRNPDYAALPGDPDGMAGNKTASVERIRFVLIPDEAAARAALLAGNVDLLPDARTRDLQDLRARGMTISSHPSMDLQAILFQTRDPLLQDVRIRRAIAMALDVPEIVRAVTEGQSRASRSPIPPASGFNTPAMLEVPARDLDGARRLLREAGYNGQPLKIITTRRYEAFYEIAVVAQDMLKEAGINAEIEVLEWATQLDRYNAGTYQMMSFGYSARLDPSLSYEMFTGPKATQTRKLWDSPEVQAILEATMSEPNPDRRRAAFVDLHRRLMEDVPMIALYSSVTHGASRPNVQGYRSWSVDAPRLWGVRLAR
ncbi:ABC transporter substrate-binding protein [Roseomonas sp. CCTCC AB2023176]|uniref:ABC transporter substrate-binding protein n=1 Tax=Roseomonas sp. CCTCC AB2023176 TaxID=3342640 RepID=UPI0035E1DDB5